MTVYGKLYTRSALYSQNHRLFGESPQRSLKAPHPALWSVIGERGGMQKSPNACSNAACRVAFDTSCTQQCMKWIILLVIFNCSIDSLCRGGGMLTGWEKDANTIIHYTSCSTSLQFDWMNLKARSCPIGIHCEAQSDVPQTLTLRRQL